MSMNEERTFWQKAGKWAARATWRQALSVPVLYVALGAARGAVLVLPFRLYAPLFGAPSTEPDEAEKASVLTPEAERNGARARRIGVIIEAVARFTPWKSNCLAQALVVAVCLRLLKIGFSVHFGVARTEDAVTAVEAHSWVMVGAFPVTGFRESRGMTCVQTFEHAPA
ncbi:MAG: lasso peptide biosynthesis B2 protein [Pseudomonadota bacterium]